MILIMGYGLLGRHLSDYFRERNIPHVVAGNDRTIPAGVDFHYLDYADIDQYAGLFEQFETVIHLIHTTVPLTSYENPLKDSVENIDNTLRFLDIIRQSDTVKKLIYISSGGAVYGFPEVQPVTEQHQLKPVSPYGMSKAHIERLIEMFGQQGYFEYAILRPSNVYGLHHKAIREHGIVSQVLAALRDGSPVDVWGDGEGRKDYIYARDFSTAMELVLDQWPMARGKIFNLASGHTYTVNEIIAVAERVSGRQVPHSHSEARSFDVSSIRLDGSLFRATFGWEPQVELAEGFRRIMKAAGL